MDILVLLAGKTVWSYLRSLGGIGLVLWGFADNSIFPTPGSMDLFVILLSAGNPELFYYYALMATAGSLLGAYPTYRLGLLGGEEMLEKKLSKDKMAKVCRKFKANGFAALFIPALLPPPIPISPFLLAAGALKYPLKRFLIALGAGRAIRYLGIAFLARIYGRQIIGFINKYQKPVMWGFIAMLALSIGAGLFMWWRQKRQPAAADAPAPPVRKIA